MKRLLVSMGLCVVILVAGVVLILVARMTNHARSSQDDASESEARRVSVFATPIERTLVEDRLILTGTVLPRLDVTVSAEGMGKIEQLAVEEGDSVQRGAELARIDTELIRAQLDQARAEARLAEQEFERAQSLSERGVSARRDFDTAVANREMSQARLRALQVELDKSVITAPFNGVVDMVFREEQEFIEIGAPLVRLVQLDEVKVLVGVPERDIGYFDVGDSVTVRLDAFAANAFEGRIHRIATTGDMETHTFTVEILVDNRERRIRPGMIARAALVRKAYPDSILVPIFSTFLLDDQRYVYVVENDVARLRSVESGIVQGGNVQILDGLDSGDLIIVRGQYNVRDGDPVQVQEVEQRDGPG